MKKMFCFIVMLIIANTAIACIKSRNVLHVFLNENDSLLVNGKYTSMNELSDLVKLYIANPGNNWRFADKKVLDIEFIGECLVSKGVVSIACSRLSTYSKYVLVQNELEKAFNELRNELSLQEFNKSFHALDAKRKQAILIAIPKTISEAEPEIIRSRDGKLIRNPIYDRFCVF